MSDIPMNKGAIVKVVTDALKEKFSDPVVEIQMPTPTQIRLRVNQGARGPRYYNVKVSQEI